MKDTVHLKEINCSNCGGQIRFEPSTQLVVCNFCGSSFDIMKAESVQTESPDSIVPFKITKQQFQRLIFPWLIQGDYTPDDILFSATLQRIDGIYLPFYLVEGEYSGSWAASSGYYRRETYTEYVRKSRYEAGRTIEYTEPVTRSQTVIDWRPSSGNIQGAFQIFGIATSRLNDEIAEFCEGTEWGSADLKNFDTKYAVGFGLEGFSLDERETIQTRIVPKVDARIGSEVHGMIPGDQSKDVNWTAQKRINRTSRLYLPFWLATYSYKNKQYQCVLDGQLKNRIAGNRPVDEARLQKIQSFFLPFKISLAFWALIFIASMATEYRGDVFLVGALPVILSGMIGLWRKNNLLTESHQIRRQYLAQIEPGTGTGTPQSPPPGVKSNGVVLVMGIVLFLVWIWIFLGTRDSDDNQVPSSTEDSAQQNSARQQEQVAAPIVSRFTDNGDGTVTDTETNLMWAARDNGSDITWDDAMHYCENYTGGGQTGWRMPSIEELRSLYDSGFSQPTRSGDMHCVSAIDITDERVWSSETYGPSYAQDYGFLIGNATPDACGYSYHNRALPVRSRR